MPIHPNMPTFSNKNPSTSLQRKLCIKSNLISLLAEQDQSHSSSDPSKSGSTVEKDDICVETLSDVLLPHGNEWHPAQNGSDDDDLTHDSYMSYQPSPSHPSDESDDDEDLVAAVSWSPTSNKEDLSESGNAGVITASPNSSMMHHPATLDKPEEYPNYNDELQLDTSEMAMLDLLVLCDSSGAHCGFYNDLLMLLRSILKRDLPS